LFGIVNGKIEEEIVQWVTSNRGKPNFDISVMFRNIIKILHKAENRFPSCSKCNYCHHDDWGTIICSLAHGSAVDNTVTEEECRCPKNIWFRENFGEPRLTEEEHKTRGESHYG